MDGKKGTWEQKETVLFCVSSLQAFFCVLRLIPRNHLHVQAIAYSLMLKESTRYGARDPDSYLLSIPIQLRVSLGERERDRKRCLLHTHTHMKMKILMLTSNSTQSMEETWQKQIATDSLAGAI